MSNFKKGDRVVRNEIYEFTDDFGFMQKGEEYIVDGVDERGLFFKGSKQGYSRSKFTLIPKNEIILQIIKDL